MLRNLHIVSAVFAEYEAEAPLLVDRLINGKRYYV
jgi:hypothetical protein